MTDRFTPNAIPPHDAPQGVLAWIELPTGNVYLDSSYIWIDPQNSDRSDILNRSVRYLKPGPADGSLLKFHCMFIRAFYWDEYPIFQRILDDFGNENTIY